MSNFQQVYPQILGIFPIPLSFLILPYVENWEKYIYDAIKLKFDNLPNEWLFIKYIYENNIEKAVENIKLIREENVRKYNLALIKRDEVELQLLKKSCKNPLLNELISLLLSFNSGRFYFTKINRRDIKAFTYFINAIISIQTQNNSKAIQFLDSALQEIGDISPIFRAQILYKKGNIIYDEKGESFQLITLYEEILNILRDIEAWWLKGELYFHLGNMYSTFGQLNYAIENYNKALKYVDKQKNPYLWALIHNNKGLAYLSIPMQDLEDQFRLAMGIQNIKKALEIFTKDKYPKEWASATLNYANALQYLPSGNPLKNLIKALNLYKEVLEYREKVGDKEGYARVLANMGNALAHLGKLKEAKEKLLKAKNIFEELGFHEEIKAIDQVLNEIEALEVAKDERSRK